MLFLVDTLEFAVSGITCNDLLYYLGIENLSFDYRGRFRFNYKSSLYSGGIIIGFDNDTSIYDCYVVMSGKGCRTLESCHGGEVLFDWQKFIFKLNELDISYRRIDIACDRFDDLFSVKTCISYYSKGKFASRSTHVEGSLFSKSEFQVGSGKSNMLVRIYDKALERGFSDSLIDGHPWLRCEMQLRDEYVLQFIQSWFSLNSLGAAYQSYLMGFMRFLSKPNDHENSQRIPTARFWSKFLNDAAALKFSSSPGVEYNYSQTERYLMHQASSSVKTYALYNDLSPEQLYARLVSSDDIKLNSDQLALLLSKYEELPFKE